MKLPEPESYLIEGAFPRNDRFDECEEESICAKFD